MTIPNIATFDHGTYIESTNFKNLSWRKCLDEWIAGSESLRNELINHHIPWRIHVWYIYLHEWLIFMVNVGKYTSPMDPMGI